MEIEELKFEEVVEDIYEEGAEMETQELEAIEDVKELFE